MSGYAEQQHPVSTPPAVAPDQTQEQDSRENKGDIEQGAESEPCPDRTPEEEGAGNPGAKSKSGGDVNGSEQSARERAEEEERTVDGVGSTVSSREKPEGEDGASGDDDATGDGGGGGGDKVSTAAAGAAAEVASGVRHAAGVGVSGVRGRLTQAGQKARKSILGALMPAAACLVDDPAAEVRGTTAVTLGEMLRLMVGFEDYVATLGSSARKPSAAAATHTGVRDGAPPVGDGLGRGVEAAGAGTGEVGATAVVARSGADGDGGSGSTGVYGGGSMETCCCVTGQDGDEDGDEDANGSVGAGGGSVGPRRRVCHGRVMQAAMAAAAAAADAVAEAAMTAELIDLAGFEGIGVEDEAVDGGIGLGEEQQQQEEDGGVMEGLPFAKHEDAEVGGRDLVSLCDSTALLEDGEVERGEGAGCADVETSEAQGTPAGQDSSEERSEELSRDDHPVPPETDSGDAPAAGRAAGLQDGAPANQHSGGDTSRDDARATEAAGLHLKGGEEATADAAESSNAVSGCDGAELETETETGEGDEDGSLDSNDAVNGRDDLGEEEDDDPDGEALPAGSAAGAAGGAVAADGTIGTVGSSSDPLIVLVTRLLLDADANVACTMLQALRPGWVPELGPGPGPKPFGGSSSNSSSSSSSGSAVDAAPSESGCAAPAPAGVEASVTETGSGSPGGGDGGGGNSQGDGDVNCQKGAGEGGGEFQEAVAGEGSGSGGVTPVARRSCLLTPAQVMESTYCAEGGSPPVPCVCQPCCR